MAHEQSEQRSEQKTFAQEAAMAMPMMTMATMATEDHVPQGQDTKQTQHFVFLRFVVSHVPVIRACAPAIP